MPEATVSVIVPSYNHGRYVLQAIESVLAQDWPTVDLIVIDDGSTDDSPELLQRFHKQRGGFTLLAQKDNRGLIRTLNRGLSQARGEYVCELASDDYLPTDSLRKRAAFLHNHPECVAVFTDGFVVADEKSTDERLLDEKRRNLFRRQDPIPDLLRGTAPVFATGLFMTAILKDIGGFDEDCFRYYEDLEIPIRLCQRGRIGFLDEALYFRRNHATNTSLVSHHIRAEKVRCYEKLKNDPQLAPYRKLINYRLRRHYLALGRYLRTGQGTEQEKVLFRKAWSIARDPRLLWYLFRIK